MTIATHNSPIKFKDGIAFLSFCPVVGGVSTYQATQLEWLTGQVDLALLDEFPENTLRRLDDESLRGVTSIQIPLWSDTSQVQSWLVNWVEIHRPRVIAVSNPGVLVKCHRFLTYARRRIGTKVVLTHHSGVFDLRRLLLEMVSSFFALIVDDLIYVSAFTRNYWEQRYPWMRRIPSRVIPNSIRIPFDCINSRRLSEKVRIGFVGRLSFEKDPELFCRVAKFATRQNLDWQFDVYGNGPLFNCLQQQYSDYVQWHGVVLDINAIFREVDLLLITSPLENCPYALLEAKSLGVPTVARAVGGIPEILSSGRDGYLAMGHQPEHLFLSLKKAVANYELLSQGCLEQRVLYDINLLGKKMWERYLQY